MKHEHKPALKKKRLPNIDACTYGGTPAATFLADLLNTAITSAQPNIGTLVRKYGKIHESFNVTRKDLSAAFEQGYLKRTVSPVMELVWAQTSNSMANLAFEMKHLDQRIPNLCRNVLAGEYKAFKRAIIHYGRAKLRQQTWMKRIAAGKDIDDTIIEDGVLLVEDGYAVPLYFEHFYEDHDEKMDELWSRAKT